jgi:chloramphenicol-sensitive protein RarD
MALTLGISFAFYGYARKKINIKPIPTLFLESMLLLLPSLIYIIYARWGQGSYFFKNNYLFLWIIFSGVITSLPLVWFASSTKYLKLSTIGIMQYIAPTLGFFLGVFLYKEPFDVNMLIMFIFIWIGVFIYTFESLRYNKN